MIVESAKDIGKAMIVMTSAAISYVTSNIGPGFKVLGSYDKAISSIAGLVAIVVGLMTIYNFIRKWRAKPNDRR